MRELGACAGACVARQQVRTHIGPSVERFQDFANVRHDMPLLQRQGRRKQLLVPLDHPLEKIRRHGHTHELECPHGDLIVGQSRDSDGRQVEVLSRRLANRLFPRRHTGLAGRQQRAVDVPENDRHAI